MRYGWAIASAILYAASATWRVPCASKKSAAPRHARGQSLGGLLDAHRLTRSYDSTESNHSV
jgi:hypothetical protein